MKPRSASSIQSNNTAIDSAMPFAITSPHLPALRSAHSVTECHFSLLKSEVKEYNLHSVWLGVAVNEVPRRGLRGGRFKPFSRGTRT